MLECATCPKYWIDTGTYRSRDQHFLSTGHQPQEFECDSCSLWFSSDEDRWDHMDRKRHWNMDAVECNDCYTLFKTWDRLSHHEAYVHFLRSECDLYFQNRRKALEHTDSWMHFEKDIPCPFCGTVCWSAADVTNHLLEGRCPDCDTPCNRNQTLRSIQKSQPNGFLARKMLEACGIRPQRATEKAWVPALGDYQYPLCYKGFANLNAVNQHLASPHQSNHS